MATIHSIEAVQPASPETISKTLCDVSYALNYVRDVSLHSIQHFVADLIGGGDVKEDGVPALEAIRLIAEEMDRKFSAFSATIDLVTSETRRSTAEKPKA